MTAPSLVTGGWLCQAVRRYGSSADRSGDDPAQARDHQELQHGEAERAPLGQDQADEGLVTTFNRAGKVSSVQRASVQGLAWPGQAPRLHNGVWE